MIKLHVKSKVAVVFTAMGILLALSVGYATYTLNYRQAESHYTKLALNSAIMAASLVDGNRIDGYLSDGADASYDASYESLRKLKVTYNLAYLYIAKPDVDQNSGIYIFDIYTDENDRSLIAELGESTGEMDVYDIVLETYLTGNSVNNAIITNTIYGYLASAYAPIYASNGTISAVVGADISMDIIIRDVRAQTVQILCTALGIIAAFLFVLLLSIHRQILTPIVRLSRHMENFTSEEGQFHEFPVSNTGDELQSMSESFNRMVRDIRLYLQNLTAVTMDRERIATELNVAATIQASMLPCIFPPFPDRKEFDIYASMLPAKEVGGDFYDFFLIDENKLAVVIADVSGKGVPAALFMVIAKTLIKNNACAGQSPGEVFETVNNMLCENNEAGMFVTALMGYLDLQTRQFSYVNAGHNLPLLQRADGEFMFLNAKPSFILAGFANMAYREEEIELSPGDMLFLYTDGVTETVDPNQELFSNTRLLVAANKYRNCTTRYLLEMVKKEIDIFAAGEEQADDITMLALKLA